MPLCRGIQMHPPSPRGGLPTAALTCARWGVHLQDNFPDGAGGGRDALEGKGPQRRPQKRLGRRLEEVAKAVGGGYCRLQMPLKLADNCSGTCLLPPESRAPLVPLLMGRSCFGGPYDPTPHGVKGFRQRTRVNGPEADGFRPIHTALHAGGMPAPSHPPSPPLPDRRAPPPPEAAHELTESGTSN